MTDTDELVAPGRLVARAPASRDEGAETCRDLLFLLGARRVSIWRFDESDGTLSPVTGLSRDPEVPGGASPVPLTGWVACPASELPPLARVVRALSPVEVHDVSAGGGRFGELAAELAMESARLMPLRSDESLGVLVVEPAGCEASAAAWRLGASAACAVLASPIARRRRAERELLVELVALAVDRHPGELLRLGAARAAELFGVDRCALYLRERSERLVLRVCERPDGPAPDLAASSEGVRGLLESALSTRSAVAASLPCGPGPALELRAARPLSHALAVPVGDSAVLVLEGAPAHRFDAGDAETALVVGALLVGPAKDAIRRREEEQHEASAAAFRQLLESGVAARSPIEAAEAIAGAAARVLDFSVGCAYLVDEEGKVSELVTVGAAPGRGEALRSALVGELAADSPMWQRTVEREPPGPDFVPDSRIPGIVRPGGVAEILGLRSIVSIPLLSSDGALGLVLCGDPSPRAQLRRDDQELLMQLALEGAVVVDNARLRQSERHEATHDALTGLLNRRAFLERLLGALEASAEGSAQVAILLLDLDGFKEVNDRFGHRSGDELLVAVARRLRASLREGDVLARLGGDEFALVLTSAGDLQGAAAVAEEIGTLLRRPFEISGHSLEVEASVGVACASSSAGTAEEVLQCADIAMYAAKRAGSGFALYRDE